MGNPVVTAVLLILRLGIGLILLRLALKDPRHRNLHWLAAVFYLNFVNLFLRGSEFLLVVSRPHGRDPDLPGAVHAHQLLQGSSESRRLGHRRAAGRGGRVTLSDAAASGLLGPGSDADHVRL